MSMSTIELEAIRASRRHGGSRFWCALLVLAVPVYALVMSLTQPVAPVGCESMGAVNPQQLAAATGQVSTHRQVDVVCYPELATAP